MPDALENPDWFDAFWSKHEKEIPIWLRGQKKLARQLLGGVVESLGAYGKTPAGIQQIIAFARITAIMKSVGGAMTGPDPSPEDVVARVEWLVQKVKP
jgi:hypothetical protein